jgi:lipopolysaccharide core galacturonosyltransferase RgtB
VNGLREDAPDLSLSHQRSATATLKGCGPFEHWAAAFPRIRRNLLMKPDMPSPLLPPVTSSEIETENATRWDIILPVLLFGYFLLNFLLRLMVSDSLEFDEAEQVVASQWFAFGYGTQPPFYNWLQYLVFSVAGVSIASLAVLKNTILLGFYLLSWRTARLLLPRPEHAVIATLGLLTIPQVAFESQRDLTHTVGAIFCAGLFLYGLFFTLKKPTLGSYAVTGLATGLGLVSKYNFALLPAAAFLVVLIHPQWRKRVFDIRFLATAVVALLAVAPHASWLLGNLDMASQNTLSKMQASGSLPVRFPFFTGVTSLIIAVIGFGGLTVLCYWLAFGNDFLRSRSASSPWTQFIETMLLAMAACMLLVLLLTGAEHVKDRWLAPLLVVLPLYFTLKLSAAGRLTAEGTRRFITLALAVMVIVPTILGVRLYLPQWTGEYEKLNYPHHAFVDRLLEDVGKRPGLILAGDTHLGGNLRLYLPDVPVYSSFLPSFQPNYRWDDDRPIVAAWHSDTDKIGEIPPDLRAAIDRFAGPAARIESHTVGLPYIHGADGDLYHFGYAVIYPAY